jgi:hypothetical protein
MGVFFTIVATIEKMRFIGHGEKMYQEKELLSRLPAC